MESRLAEIMREKGIRRTPQRLAVWREFSRRPGLTIREAARRLEAAGIGQATVYRSVKALEGAGLLLGFPAPGGELRYAAVLGHAHLLVCEKCGRVTQFGECRLGDYETEVQRKTGYRISGHTLVIYGVCPHCQEGGDSASKR
ncbi:Fur family transcriptional regulator [Oceanithermus sp.]